MATVYLEILEQGSICIAPIETVITLFTMNYCHLKSKTKFKTKLMCKNRDFKINGYEIDIYELDFYRDIEYCELQDNNCELPYLCIDNSSYIAGLCACLRQIVKFSSHSACKIDLLGFKNSCLMACSETSIWTKYCEVDLISLLNTFNVIDELPIDLARFEFHLSEPLRLHNIHKYSNSKRYQAVSNIYPKTHNGIPDHIYAEGCTMSLADIIIFVCIHCLLNYYSKTDVFALLPLTAEWYERMKSDEIIAWNLRFISLSRETLSPQPDCFYSLPKITVESLYKRDVRRYKSRNQIYTRQEDIENSLKIIRNINEKFELFNETWEDDINFDWSTIPYDATPEGGALPSIRSERKYQQLESMCKPILKLAKHGDTIVDFCSGSGHLGILIAFLLPECTIILLENKEESLNRSKLRVDKLNLNNVKFYQCNLDYFTGKFDIGTSLHACGVATDLVLRQCITKNAVFVCCPCCYGKIQNCHHITYPQSNIYKDEINIRDYLVLGHAADQTHDALNSKTKQGYECMNSIDNDRKLCAEQFGYKVHLTKLKPESCTPKNNLLIGIPMKQKNNYSITDIN
ncbi:hypothetical protein PV325_003349 [Microctonus aethiopoides]|nr:hypothetical protein PV325_003349 [Microctonus aethiopoides]